MWGLGEEIRTKPLKWSPMIKSWWLYKKGETDQKRHVCTVYSLYSCPALCPESAIARCNPSHF
jgi:hypothetical protein